LREVWAAIAFVVSLFAASGATYAYVAKQVTRSAPRAERYYERQDSWMKACLSREALAPLARLPKGRVLAFVDQGPAVLAYTHHAAVGGPYHRNAAGILDTYAAFTGTPSDAARIVRRRQIDYVAMCPSAPDFAYYRRTGGDESLIAVLSRGRPVSWLVRDAASSNGVQVYRVLPERLH
jgi:hypothetical protein